MRTTASRPGGGLADRLRLGGGDNRVDLLLFAAVAALVIVGPAALYPVLLMKAMCFAIFASAFNLAAGYGGLLSFGHAAFFGSASYATAYGMKAWGLSPEVAIVFSMVVAGAVAFVFGALSIRRQGIYFAMVTLALSQIIYFFIYKSGWTGGDDGIHGVPRGALLGLVSLDDPVAIYAFVTVVFIATNLFVYRVIHSPFGRAVEAIRLNEARAISLGYDADRFKLAIFTISGVLSGLGGALLCLVLHFTAVNTVHWAMSGDVILMTLIGGLGTPFGPILGAFVLVTLDQYIASLGSWVTVIRGLIFMFCVLAFREGIMGAINRSLGRT